MTRKNEIPVWRALEIEIDRGSDEAIEFALNSLGSLGTEINYLRHKNDDSIIVVGYFESLPDEASVRAEMSEALRIYGLPNSSVRNIRRRVVEQTDWLREWKKHWKPTFISRFVIAPPWENIEETDRIVIRIEPNMAFGTGTHETTQLCLKAIEENYQHGQDFLDVGTGTGILAIAAALFDDETSTNPDEIKHSTSPNSSRDNFSTSSPRFLAIDTDPDSIEIASQNARMNNTAGKLEFRVGTVTEETPPFDLICANLTIDVILQILPLLVGKTKQYLILWGNGQNSW